MGGSHAEFPYTFKVGLKRATLIVRLEHPLAIDRASVARNIPDSQVEQTKIRTMRDKLIGSMDAQANISPTKMFATAGGRVAGEREQRVREELKIVQALPPILAVSEPRSPQEYAWTLEPTFMKELRGQPWDPVISPRLSARYNFHKLGPIEPVIEAKITCALEDITIEDIQPKDRTITGRVAALLSSDTRIAAAKQHLKQVLRLSSLEPGEMDNRFAPLLIATALATVEEEG